MKYFFIGIKGAVISFLFCSNCQAQSESKSLKDTLHKPLCPCSWQTKFKYPKNANTINDKIIVEIKVDSLGFLYSPKIVKAVGYGYDEEAMKATDILISSLNECNKRCGYNLERRNTTIKQVYNIENIE